MAGSAWGQRATGVRATSLPYNPQQNNYDLQAAFDAGQSHAWRSRYGWAAFCGPVGPTGQAACGRCLKIRRALLCTNNLMQNDVCLHVQLTRHRDWSSSNGKFVDQCSTGGLHLDTNVFNQIDQCNTNGNGNAQGRLFVNYDFVNCGDWLELLIPNPQIN